MNKELSRYFEVIRAIATLLVLFSHGSHFLPEQYHMVFKELKLGRDGVIFFFVLSGFVITWCAVEKDRTATSYFINRASRIYTVAIPGLILGAIASLAYSISMDKQIDYTFAKAYIYYPLFLTFMSQGWLGFIVPAGNFPYWSLSFEVWYYIFLGGVVYVKGYLKLAVCLIVLVLMGPHILLLFPIWASGALLYKFVSTTSKKPQKLVLQLVFYTTIIAYLLVKFYGIDTYLDQFNYLIVGEWNRYLNAKQWLGDLLITLIAVLNFYSFYHLKLTIVDSLFKPFKFIANFSFSIYMYHIPIFILLSIFEYFSNKAWLTYGIAITINLIVAYLLSLYTEQKKGLLRDVLLKCLEKVKLNKRPPIPG